MTAFLPAFFGLLLQSTGLLLLGLFALRLARRRGPVVQSLIGRATLAGVALLILLAPLMDRIPTVWRIAPPVSASQASFEVPTLPQEPTPLPTHSSQAASPPETGRARDLDKKPLAVGGLTSSSSRFGRTPVSEERGNKEVSSLPYFILSALWGMGTTALLLWLGLCQWHLTRLRRSADPVTSGPSTAILAGLTMYPPPLLAHPAVHSPFLAGLRRPAIFLPVAYEAEFDPAALRAILAHELAHLARRDNAWTLVAHLLCAALWPQPLLWVLCRRLEQISEEACDQAVLAQNCSPRAYADCLLTLAERHPLGHRERTLGAGVAPFRSSLGRRIGRILDKGTHAMSITSPHLRFSVAAGVVAAALASAFLVSASPTAKPARKKVVAVTPSVSLPESQRHQIIGEIVYEDDRPAPGVAVMARMTNESQGKLMAQHKNYLTGTSADTTSGTDGSFTLRNLREGFYDVMEREASGKWVAHAIENVSVSHTVTRIPNLLLSSGAVITGTVTNKQTRRPMPKMYVYSLGPRYPASMGGSSSTQTDADGKYSLRVVPGDNWVYISGLGKNQGYVTGQIGISPMSTNPKYPVYDRGFHVLISKGKTQVTSIYAVPAPPSAQARITAAGQLVPNRLSQAEFLAGLTAVSGPGVVLTLNDSKRGFPGGMPPGMTPPSLIHDTDINQVVNELKASGAEAIAVNNERLVATSPIRCVGPVIFVNNVPQTPPFTIQAIGSPKTLYSALNIRGGIATQLKAFDSAMFSIREAETLKLPAYFSIETPRYAKPVRDEGKDKRQAALINRSRSELQATAANLKADQAKLDFKLTSLKQSEDQKRDQIDALGNANMTIAALQALDRQRALFQLRILLAT